MNHHGSVFYERFGKYFLCYKREQGLKHNDDRSRAFNMFILRITFWLFLLVILLPEQRDEEQLDTLQQSNVSTRELAAAASNTIDDLAGFCERNPQICLTGKEFADMFMRKARYGVNMLLNMFDTEPSITEGNIASNDTLEPLDRKPEWSSPMNDEKQI